MKHKTTAPLHKQHLYQFKTLKMDDFIREYTYEITPHEIVDEDTISVFAPAKMKMSERKRGTVKPDIITNKCRYLQDAIIRRAYSRFDSLSFSLNAEVLKAVIGAEYRTMLDVLTKMGFIGIGDGGSGKERHWYYIPYSYSTYYILQNEEIEEITVVNQTIQAYKEETVRQTEKLIASVANGYVDDSFMKNYLKSLKYIRIANYDGLRSYIRSVLNENPKAKIYYDFVFKELENRNKRIYRIDNSHRFYHVLTNIKREVKQYLTIDFMLDCKNSHPMLFNHFIFLSHNIPEMYSCYISQYFINEYNNFITDKNPESKADCIKAATSLSIYIHNVAKNFCNSMKHSDIEKSYFARLSEDEIEYIFKTSNGLLWDEICAKHPEMNRNEVKQAMFAAVFYSKSTMPDRWNDYAKEFKKEYPTVFRLLASWRDDDNQEWVKQYMRLHGLQYREKTSLPVAMMSLESDIFTAILKRLYARRWNALHIHDCIVIPQDGNKNHPTKEQVLEVMREVFGKYGLVPSFD